METSSITHFRVKKNLTYILVITNSLLEITGLQQMELIVVAFHVVKNSSNRAFNLKLSEDDHCISIDVINFYFLKHPDLKNKILDMD